MTTSAKEIHWVGDVENCDICQQELKDQFYDAKLTDGHWAMVCHSCFKLHTFGKVGTGLGQHYQEQPDGQWLKVAG